MTTLDTSTEENSQVILETQIDLRKVIPSDAINFEINYYLVEEDKTICLYSIRYMLQILNCIGEMT